MARVLVVGCGIVGGPTADVIEAYLGAGSVLRHDKPKDIATNPGDARQCDYVIFCLPTETVGDGGPADLDMGILDSCCEEWAQHLDPGRTRFVIRSTVRPGVSEQIGAKYGFDVIYWPEYSRHDEMVEGISTPDFFVIGAQSAAIAREFIEDVLPWYADLNNTGATAGLFVPLCDAEWSKLVTNMLYSVNIVAANELSRIGREHGSAWNNVRQILDANPRLGDTYVVTEEGGYGGHCLPKDSAQVARMASNLPESALIRNVLAANEFVREEEA